VSDIEHEFPIKAGIERVFDAVSTPAGLNTWWTLTASGAPAPGARYEFGFGPAYQWAGVVTRLEPPRLIEWVLTEADEDWIGTRVGLELTAGGAATTVRFHHRGWKDANQHYRVSCCCWAMYLRILRRNIEHGESVPYEQRLDV
jgi:uncharacterized protein YndB with AHSA1/START domain